MYKKFLFFSFDRSVNTTRQNPLRQKKIVAERQNTNKNTVDAIIRNHG